MSEDNIENLPSIEDLNNNSEELPSVDEFISEEKELPSVQEFIQEEKERLTGLEPTAENEEVTLYECHCYLDLEQFPDVDAI